MENKFKNDPLFDGEIFSFEKLLENKNFSAKCSLCLPKEIHIKGSTTSRSNFLKHLKTKHATNGMALYSKRKEEFLAKAKSGKNKRTDRTQEMVQPKLSFQRSQKKAQNEFDKKIIKLIINTMLPLKLVDHPDFVDLFTDMGLSVMSRRTIGRKIDDLYRDSMAGLKDVLRDVEYICTTADIWSAKRRSFLGVTAHWLDKHCQRHSAALACRRIQGIHSFDKIAELLEDVYFSFDINTPSQKIIATVTDNGSNFVKAFKQYGLKFKTHEEEEEEEEYISESDDEIESFEVQSLESESILRSPILPRHLRCATHTLNLIATTDINNVINKNVSLRSRHEKSLQKCQLLWGKASRPKSAEIIQEEFGHTLSYPIVTRWNSFYASISQILCEKSKLKSLFEKLEIKDFFKEAELQHLDDYCKILEPIAATINYLQGEENTYYGLLLPSILSLKVKLEKLREELSINNSRLMLDKVLESLATRFSDILEATNKLALESIIAAVVIPKVKTRWINIYREINPDIDASKILKMVIQEAKNVIPLVTTAPCVSVPGERDEDDFFDFKEIGESAPSSCFLSVPQNVEIENSLELELFKYMEDRRSSLDMLEDYKIIKKIFLRYNTCLPSSAPVERLFSFASMINAPKRHALSDNLFQKLVLLKANKCSFTK